jgi:hypothetical protein
MIRPYNGYLRIKENFKDFRETAQFPEDKPCLLVSNPNHSDTHPLWFPLSAGAKRGKYLVYIDIAPSLRSREGVGG